MFVCLCMCVCQRQLQTVTTEILILLWLCAFQTHPRWVCKSQENQWCLPSKCVFTTKETLLQHKPLLYWNWFYQILTESGLNLYYWTSRHRNFQAQKLCYELILMMPSVLWIFTTQYQIAAKSSKTAANSRCYVVLCLTSVVVTGFIL